MPNKYFRLFQRLVGLPYLLAILGLLMPLANVSCTEQVIAEPSMYEIALGLDLGTELKEPAMSLLKKMEEGNPRSIERFKDFIPNFPKMEPMLHLFGIAAALFLAAVFALLAPLGYYASLGSLALGMLSSFRYGFVLRGSVQALCKIGFSSCSGVLVKNALGCSLVDFLDRKTNCLLLVVSIGINSIVSFLDSGLEGRLGRLVASCF